MKQIRRISIWIFLALLLSASYCHAIEKYDVAEDKGAFWNRRVWFAVRSSVDKKSYDETGESRDNPSWNLYSVKPGSAEKPKEEPGVTIPLKLFWLFGGEDRLWVISAESVGWYKDGKISFVDMKNELSDITRPFLYRGKPAVVDYDGDAFNVNILEDNKWIKDKSFKIKHQRTDDNIFHYLEVVTTQDELHLFLQNEGGSIYHFKGIPTKEYEDVTKWELTAKMEGISSCGYWSSVKFKDYVALFHLAGKFATQIEGYRLQENKWEQFFKPNPDVSSVNSYGIYPTGHYDDFVMLIDTGIRGWKGAITFQNGMETAKSTLESELTIILIFCLTVACAILISPILLIIFIIIKIDRKLRKHRNGAKPRGLSRFTLTRYRKTKEYPKEQVDVAGIMAAEFKKIKGLKVKKIPEKNALSVRQSFVGTSSQRWMAPQIPALIEFEETGDVVKITMTVKIPLANLIFLFILFFTIISIPCIYIKAFAPLLIVFLIVILRKNYDQFFHLFMVALGIEEAVDIKELI